MAQIAPLSLAEETFKPVEIRFWVVARAEEVEFRFCRAVSAEPLVMMLLLTVLSFSQGSVRILQTAAFCLAEKKQLPGHRQKFPTH